MWKAKDSKLGREVAIKTLPEEFANDVDRLARFEREAKLLASVNHSVVSTGRCNTSPLFLCEVLHRPVEPAHLLGP